MCRTTLCRTLALFTLSAWPAAAQTTLYDVLGAGDGEHLGDVVAALGDVDLDGLEDFVVGSPDDSTGGTLAGRALVVSGSGAILHTFLGQPSERLGAAVAPAGDVNGDGHADVLVGAPRAASFVGRAIVFSGLDGSVLYDLAGTTAFDTFGGSLAAGGRLDGDGVDDFLVAAPGEDAGGDRRGVVYAFSGATGQVLYSVAGEANGHRFGRRLVSLGDVSGDGRDDWAASGFDDFEPTSSFIVISSGADGSELSRSLNPGSFDIYGHSLAALGDVDGDGAPDLLVGAPGFDCGHCGVIGHVEVRSGADSSLVYQVNGTSGQFGFGHAVASLGDLDLDGIADFAASQPGAPDGPFGLGGRTVRVLSGVDGAPLFTFEGDLDTDRFGWWLAGVDANGDGQREVLVGAPRADAGGDERGLARVVELPAAPPTPYCTAKPSSAGCVPAIGSSGTPSVSGGSFDVTCTSVPNNKFGLLFYGYSPADRPFQGGRFCVRGELRRTPVTSSGGNPPPEDCSGNFAFDFASRVQSGVDGMLVVGQALYAQYGYRDPNDAFGTGLSDGLRFRLRP